MTKLILIPALLTGVLALAKPYSYEISPMIGLDFPESSLGFKEDSFGVGALEIQYNPEDSLISPELSFMYSKPEFANGGSTHLARVAANGVHTYNKDGFLKPFVKAGLGVETFSTNDAGNNDGLFLDAGAGLKVQIIDQLALKLEGIYLLKNNHNNWDRNAIALAGLTYSFGADKVKEAPKPEPIVKTVVPVVPVDGDDDRDGVLNSKDKCPTTAAGKKVNNRGCFIDGDDDRDGVLNSKDNCKHTPLGTNVDSKGCFLDSDDDKDGIMNLADKCLSTPMGTKVDAFGCEEDKDKDGVLNARDFCPNTIAGETVNTDGCPESVKLSVNFENNSFVVKQESHATIQKMADFLNRHHDYSAKIIGYTDSRGKASYNKYLSQKRSSAVKELLIKKGAPSSSLTSVGRGERNPIASNKTKEGRAENRRIEAELTKH